MTVERPQDHHRLLSGKEEPDYFQIVMDQIIQRMLARRHAVEMLPPHFLSKTFRANGGRLENIFYDGCPVGYAFHIPLREQGKTIARVHILYRDADLSLPDSYYDAKSEPAYDGRVLKRYPDYTIKLPSREEADQIPSLQREVWGYPDKEEAAIYPKDLFGKDRGAATRLVAVSNNGEVVGSQLGFYGCGRRWLGDPEGILEDAVWLESQISSVRQDQQGKGIATSLKWQQAQDACRENIPLIRWTVDPLLLGNAIVNFNHLGAIATDYKPAQYNFTNSQNLVSASRFGVSWFLESPRTKKAKEHRPPLNNFDALKNLPETEIIYPAASGFDPGAFKAQNMGCLLINIPSHWKQMQNEDAQKGDMRRSLEWRSLTDKLFSTSIGTGNGKYVITEVVNSPDGEWFLVARPFAVIRDILEGKD